MTTEAMDIMEKLGAFDLHPVEEREGWYFKRSDLYSPFGAGSVNGGKLLQGIHFLAGAASQGALRVRTGCSINSPQAPMTAAVSQALNMECVCYYGTSPEYITNHSMPMLAKEFGATFKFCKSGRSNVLYHRIKQDLCPGDVVVEYGMNSKDPKNLAAFYDTTANQVRNLPDDLNNLFITCGSGITSTGILYGLKKYRKSVDRIFLFGNGPHREKKIRERLVHLELATGVRCRNAKFHYEDLFGQGVKYEERVSCVFKGITLHPNYEAKAGKFILQKLKDFPKLAAKKNCLWIIGAEPKLKN